MKQKFYFYCILFFMICVALAILAPYWVMESLPVDKSDLERIELNMTKQSVENILGPPSRISGDTWWYTHKCKWIMVTISFDFDGKVYEIEIDRQLTRSAAFEAILAEGLERVDMRICGYCVMSNHWHLLLWPRNDGDLSDYMRWITLTHTQRYHASHGTTGIGHLYQGRYKSFPIQANGHYLTVLRHIEANPLRAEIVESPDKYPWSSYAVRKGPEKPFSLSEGPVQPTRKLATTG